MHSKSLRLIALVAAILVALDGCGQSTIDSTAMRELAAQLSEKSSFQYPLDEYFPETPVTMTDPPRGERHHTGEDSYAPPGTPVYAIEDGIIGYSGKKEGYGWLIIIDHPSINVYSLYGHLSTSRWKKSTGEVKKGEQIAYLGEAEEGQTMVSHLHFGMRTGQMSDYPGIGDWRWMAGYTRSRPDLVGWFQPSEIIGQTDSMKIWHQYIRKREGIATSRTLQFSDFKITPSKHNEKEDLDQLIRNELGNDYRLADWNDILAFSANIEEWADRIGLNEGEKNSLMISNEGYRIWLRRQYYISRFNHNKPRDYLVHDAIDNNYVCLGSWTGLNMNILAVKKR